MIRIYIDEMGCKGCGLCVYYCPREVLAMSRRTNPGGYPLVEILNEAACTGCGLCEIACPDFALYVERADRQREVQGTEENET